MDINSLLQKIGLTANEIKIYQYLLSKGVSLATNIYQDTQLDKSSAYRALANLEKLKLVFSLGQSRNQKFYADNGENLLKIQQEKEAEVVRMRSEIKQFIKDIEDYSRENYKASNIKIYEGQEDYKRYMLERLRKTGGVIREVVGADTAKVLAGNYQEFVSYFRAERIKKKIVLKVFKDKLAITNPKNLKQKEFKEVRRTPVELDFEGLSFVTFEANTGFYHFKEGKFWGIIINDLFITHFLNAMFDLIWEKSEIIY